MKIGSLFSGIGGIDLAFKHAGFDIAWANEVDSNACKTYKHNFPGAKLFQEDIRNVPSHLFEYVDVMTAGFPCQSFSVCGNKKGFNDMRGNLFFEIMRVADYLKPPVIFLENVANLTEHDNGKTFNIIYSELSSRDYFVRYLIADACNYGIPQHRTRIYIVAFKSKETCDRFQFPEQSTDKVRIFDVIDKTSKVKDSFYLDCNSYQYKKLSPAMKDESQIYRFSDYGIQTSKDGISFTLKANMGTWIDRVPYIKDLYGIRRITPYECLALQGFPYGFRFPDIPIASAYKQCGNTVAVPLLTLIAKRIATVL